MNPWSRPSSVACFACCAWLFGWAAVSRRHEPVARRAASAGTGGASQSGSQGTRPGIASYAERRLRGLRRAGMMAMPDEPKQPEINEEFFQEWIRYGFAEMQVYMVKQAQFAAWLLRHPQTEEPDGSASSPES